ncbi:nitrilase-related carbon-nitrogen hydrolase, partial [Candidatus Venteria ishoeyi]|uniref:nitrilase-related carbon-nitrogen hydrolase n=1 Tax=Candidatus Venteria ishoeyi TaxID=1899563 RepID=UPI000AD1BCDB
MHLIKLAAACLNQTPMDWDGNQKNILAAIQQARSQQVDILCLPELCISGYGCEDAFLGAGLLQQALRVLLEIVPFTQDIIVAVGLPVLHQNRVYNTVCLLNNGKIGGFVAKRFLPGDGIHYESRWFHPWPVEVQDSLQIGEDCVPFGDIYFNCGGVRIGFEICEEAWVARRPGTRLAQAGIDIILNPTASHFAFDKRETRKRLVLEGSRAFSSSYVYANLLGNEAGRVIYDGDTLIASNGEMLAAGERLSFASWRLISALVDVDRTRMNQARTSRFVGNPQACVHLDFNYPQRLPEKQSESKPVYPAWETGESLKQEEFARAVALGLYDYSAKSRSQGFALSLSGGADSAAVACLIRLMVELGVAEVGIENFCARLNLPQTELNTIEQLMPVLLVCVYQATRNSSETTRNAAEKMAHAVGAEYLELDIENMVSGYRQHIEQAIGRSLNWTQDDLALQNIQARARAPGVWMLANL